jgi:hypothetical protein
LWTWLQKGKNPGQTPPEVAKLALRWPTVVWGRIFHTIGLSNLSAEQIDAYETYRAQVARDISYPERLNELPNWIRLRGWPLLGIAVVGSFVYILALPFAPAYTALIQALVILLLFLGLPDPQVDPDRSPDDTEAARHFYRYWCAMQGAWVLLYLALFCATVSPSELSLGCFTMPGDRHSPIWETVTHFMVNLNTFFFVMCFFTLHDPPYTSSKEESIVTSARAIGMTIVVALTTAEMLCYVYDWSRQIEYLKWITGFGGGVALALLVGRLESNFLNPPLLLITLLYLYAVIQGAMATVGAAEDLERVLLYLALALKSLLLLFVAWILESDLLLNYVRQVRELKVAQASTR